MGGFEHLSNLFAGGSKKIERPKSYRSQNFRREQEQEPIVETVERRETRFEHHLSVIQKLLHELSKESQLFEGKREKKGDRRFQFKNRDLGICVSAGAQVCSGAALTGLSMTAVRVHGGPAFSSATAYLGAHMLSDGIMKLRDYFFRTEQSIRAQMLDIQSDDRFESMFRERTDTYERTRKEMPLEIQAGGEVSYLHDVGVYMDEIIAKQSLLLETMKQYHLLSETHASERAQRGLGFGAAAALLEGGSAAVQAVPQGNVMSLFRDYFSGETRDVGGRIAHAIGPQAWAALSAAAAGTFTALLFGTMRERDYGTISKSRERNVKKIFQRIEKQISALESERRTVEARFKTLTGETSEIVRQASAVSWNDAIGQVIGRELSRAQQDTRIPQTVPAVEPSFRFDPFSPGITIEEFLGLIPKEQEEPLVESKDETPEARVEQPGEPRFGSDYIPPLTFYGVELQKNLTLRPFLLGCLRRNALGDKEAPIDDLTTASSFDDVIAVRGEGSTFDPYDPQTGESIPKEGIEKLLAFLKDQHAAIKDHYNPNDKVTIIGHFGFDVLKELEDHLKLLEPALVNREVDEGKIFIAEHTGADLRSRIIKDFRIAPFSEEEAHQLGQLEFESLLASWYETTRKADREALERVLMHFNMALDSLEEERHSISDYAGIVEVIRGATQRLKRPLTIDIPEQETQRPVVFRKVRIYYTRERAQLFPEGGTRNELLSQLERVERRPFIIPSGTLAGYARTEINQIQYTKEGMANQRIDLGQKAVPTARIIGSALPRDGLILPDSRDDIIIQAERLVRQPTQQTFTEFFFDSQRGNKERISLWQFKIPVQPGEREEAIYFVDETGADAVAAAEIAGLPYTIGRVREVRLGSSSEPFVFRLSDSKEDAPRFHLLRELRRLCLIDGEIPDEIDFNGAGKKIVMKITKQVLPWTIWFFPSLPKVTNACMKAYPKLFHGLKDVDGNPLSPSALELVTDESKFYKRFIEFPLKQLQAQQGGNAG